MVRASRAVLPTSSRAIRQWRGGTWTRSGVLKQRSARHSDSKARVWRRWSEIASFDHRAALAGFAYRRDDLGRNLTRTRQRCRAAIGACKEPFPRHQSLRHSSSDPAHHRWFSVEFCWPAFARLGRSTARLSCVRRRPNDACAHGRTTLKHETV